MLVLMLYSSNVRSSYAPVLSIGTKQYLLYQLVYASIMTKQVVVFAFLDVLLTRGVLFLTPCRVFMFLFVKPNYHKWVMDLCQQTVGSFMLASYTYKVPKQTC